MAIFDEQVLEPFVAKGVGNSGIASRQIQAGNLPNLSAAVRESITTQENLAEQQKALSAAKGMVSISNAMGTQRQFGRNENLNKPFIIGKIRSSMETPGGYTVAIPDGNGSFNLRTLMTDSAGLSGGANIGETEKNKSILKELGFGIDTMRDYPELGVSGLSGTYKKNDLIQTLLAYTKGKSNSGSGISLSDIIKQIG